MRRSTYLVALTILMGVATFVIFLPLSRFSRLSSSDVVLGSRTKSLNCRAYRSLPDRNCTPGAVLKNPDLSALCAAGYTSFSAPVSPGLANQVYLQYGIYSPDPGQYQIDHLVDKSLGGSDDLSNLWPQPAQPRPGFHEKDRVEAYLYDQVCSGQMSLSQAQDQLSADWLKVFLSMPSF